jgi:hypothetical protein
MAIHYRATHFNDTVMTRPPLRPAHDAAAGDEPPREKRRRRGGGAAPQRCGGAQERRAVTSGHVGNVRQKMALALFAARARLARRQRALVRLAHVRFGQQVAIADVEPGSTAAFWFDDAYRSAVRGGGGARADDGEEGVDDDRNGHDDDEKNAVHGGARDDGHDEKQAGHDQDDDDKGVEGAAGTGEEQQRRRGHAVPRAAKGTPVFRLRAHHPFYITPITVPALLAVAFGAIKHRLDGTTLEEKAEKFVSDLKRHKGHDDDWQAFSSRRSRSAERGWPRARPRV